MPLALEEKRTLAATGAAEGPARQAETVGRLREWLSRHKQRRARRLGWTKGFVQTGLERLDTALPNGGVPNGAVTEIYSEAAGVGSLTLALRIAAGAIVPSSPGAWTRSSDRQSSIDNQNGCEKGFSHQRQFLDPSISAPDPRARSLDPLIPRSLDPLIPRSLDPSIPRSLDPSSRSIILVDTWGDFYPPAVAALNIDPESLIVIRNVNQRDAFWAVDQCLRCSAVAAVIAPLSRLDERESRRLQLAAESSGAMGLLLRQGPPRTRTFAAVRMLVEGVNVSELISRGEMASSTRHAERREASPALLAQEILCCAQNDIGPVSVDASRSISLIPRSPDPSIALPLSLRSQRAGIPSSLRSRRAGIASSLCRITLLSVREGMPADPFVVDLYHATGACDLSSIPGDRPVAKIG